MVGGGTKNMKEQAETVQLLIYILNIASNSMGSFGFLLENPLLG